MTLNELDEALTKLHLDLRNKEDLNIRDRILFLHGQSILKTKTHRCANCWMKEHNRCNPGCRLYLDSDDPVQVSKDYLSKPNDISLFPFLYLYMIPVYEEVTGRKDTMKELGKEFKQRWREEKGNVDELPNYL